MKGIDPITTFEKLAFGSGGVGMKVKRGDNITPKGTFAVGWVNGSSKFNIFIGLNYPNLEYAERAYRSGVIKEKAFLQIKDALNAGQTPPQHTPLGGYIGIHGVGKGSLEIHQAIDWTNGCVALDNGQITKLAKVVRKGMVVHIR